MDCGQTRNLCRCGNGAHVRLEGSPIGFTLPPPLLHGSYKTDVVTESEVISVSDLGLGFPDIQMPALSLKELFRAEDMLHVLGTGHLHDPEADGMPIRIPQHLG